MLSQKTNCNPLAHPNWKCHHTNFWIVKLFHLTEGLLHSFKLWRFWKEQLWVVVRDCENNRLWCVATGMWSKQCHRVFRLTTFCINTYFQSFSTLISRIVHYALLKFSPCRNKPWHVDINTRAPPVVCPRRSARAVQIIGSIKEQ